MKRITAFLLSVIIIISCGVFVVTAQTEKIHPDLYAILEKRAPDDMISVDITYAIETKNVNDMPSWPDRDAATSEYKVYKSQKQSEIQSVIFKDLDVNVLSTIADGAVIAYVKVKDVTTIASYDLVAFIEYFNITTEEPAQTELAMEGKLYEWMLQKGYIDHVDPDIPLFSSIETLYEHHDQTGKTDWAMIYAPGMDQAAWTGVAIIGNRVIESGTGIPFEFGMALYDAEKDTFYDLNKVTDYSAYNGLAKALDQYGKGHLLGDIDDDDKITVFDATFMQRCISKATKYPAKDWIYASNDSNPYFEYNPRFKSIHYFSDFNRDGKRDILDVTCIQRYLVGMTYPIGK